MFLFFFHSTTMIIISYLPVYFQSQGMVESKIGWILAVGPFASILAQPFWGYMSDKYKTVKRILFITLTGMFTLSFLLFNVTSFALLLVTAALFFSFQSPTGALGDSLASKTAHKLGKSFGSIRGWGSMGFATSTLVVGAFFSRAGIEYIHYPFLIFVVIAFIVCLKISDVEVTNKPVTLIDAVKLGGNLKLMGFLAIIMFLTVTHRANDSYIGLYIKELGGNESMIGLAWFIAVGSEAIVFMTSNLWFKKFNEITFILLAGILYAVRWILYSFIQDPMVIVFLQVTHGLTFGVFYVSAFQFVTKLLPAELQATGHLLFISVFFGLSGIIGSLAGGFIIENASGATLYSYMGYLASAGCLGLAVYLQRIRKQMQLTLSD
ncbi:MFS transporter [Pseudalkalibacillus caeni]|uniref:MFS transporter n=2 Tax=Exobacillus caeni TaxID=2574798 RepID=A0A5R9F7R5_9BACL|nr:MFS transporter [Pseudalkalibacillus caeni]